jgi:hypothetical protein
MSPIAAALEHFGRRIGDLTERFGRRVDVASLGITDREGLLELGEPGLLSPNRACRLVRAKDGWIAINLAREEDRELVPAWLRADVTGDPWDAIVELARSHRCDALIQQAILLGLPAAIVGEEPSGVASPRPAEAPRAVLRHRPLRRLRAVDLSALWAGPMCGAVLAAMGAVVGKVESRHRPDPTRVSSPEFFRRLNGQKDDLEIDLATPDGQAKLRERVALVDVLITSCRPRALPSIGLDLELVFDSNPHLTWVAITGYGWTDRAGMRVAFGDDAAAAGGLVRWTEGGEPRFLGDALSDPVTGMHAATAALEGVAAGGGRLINITMAGSAAIAAAMRTAT